MDWYGVQSGQGSYNGQASAGSPLAWTSNTASSSGFQSLNKYVVKSMAFLNMFVFFFLPFFFFRICFRWGDHYWMLDVNMDCSETEQGWFELKAFLTNSGIHHEFTELCYCFESTFDDDVFCV